MQFFFSYFFNVILSAGGVKENEKTGPEENVKRNSLIETNEWNYYNKDL